MIILGLVLLLLGFLLGIQLLWIIGVVLVIIGLILLLVGAVSGGVGGRRYWY